jgi:hypothetical protein
MNGDIDIFRERRLRDEMKEYVREQTRNVVQFTRMTKNTPLGKGDQVHGHRVEGADAVDYDYPVRRMQHFGLRSLPPAGVWVVRVGGVGGNAVIVAVGARWRSTKHSASPSTPRCTSVILRVHGSAERTRTPTVFYDSTSRRAQSYLRIRRPS